MKNGLAHLPDHSRIWMYSCERPLTATEEMLISEKLDAFTDDWTAHGAPLSAGYQIFNNRIIVLAVDEEANLASGCSIDKSTRLLVDISKQIGIDFFNRLEVYYQTLKGFEKGTKGQIEAAFELGEVNSESLVLDVTLLNLNALRTYWPIKLKDSWVGRKLATVI